MFWPGAKYFGPSPQTDQTPDGSAPRRISPQAKPPGGAPSLTAILNPRPTEEEGNSWTSQWQKTEESNGIQHLYLLFMPHHTWWKVFNLALRCEPYRWLMTRHTQISWNICPLLKADCWIFSFPRKLNMPTNTFSNPAEMPLPPLKLSSQFPRSWAKGNLY